MKKGVVKKSSTASMFTRKHIGKWVALSTDRTKVVGYATTFDALEKKVGRDGVIYTKVPDPKVSYCFSFV